MSVDSLIFTYKRHTWRLEEWIKESKDEKMKEMYEIEYRVYSKIVKDFEGLKQ
jgi:hypothetical protein